VRLALGFGLGVGAVVLAWYMTWRAREVARGTLGAKPSLDPFGLFEPRSAPTRVDPIPGIVPLPDGLTRPPLVTFIQPTTLPALAGALRRFTERTIDPVVGVSTIIPNYSAPTMQPVGGVSVTFPRYT
jgi:hypothetical protein